jgi:beta-phosphoglucomutase-like phosphatase (HAD superfamily)
MRIDVVLMEFDGIVADTFESRRRAFEVALADLGVALDVDDYWEHCAGWPTGAAVRAIARQYGLTLDDVALDLLGFRIDRAFTQDVSKGVVLVDGARSTVERLASRCRLAVVSRLRRADVDAILSLGRMDHLFSFVVGEEDAFPHKPDPAPFVVALKRLERFRGGRGTVVALEHGLPGIQSARAAGVACVAVGPQPAHVALEADGYVDSVAGLDLAALTGVLRTRKEG